MKVAGTLLVAAIILASVPFAHAQAEPVLTVVFDVIMALPYEPDSISYPISADPTTGCQTQGTIRARSNGFSFEEPEFEAGCAEAWFNVTVPPGASTAEVHYAADRHITSKGVNGVAPRLVQDLKVGTAPWYHVFDAYAPAGSARGPAPVCPVADVDVLTLRWRFSDEGQTEAAPARFATTGQRFEASVTRPTVHFPNILAVTDESTQSFAAEPASLLTRHHIRFHLDAGADRVDIRMLPNGASIKAVTGPDNTSIPLAGTGDLPGWLQLTDAAPGAYEVVMESVTARPPVFVLALPLFAVGVPGVAAAVAAGAHVSWARSAHPTQGRALSSGRAGLAVLALGLLAYWAFAGVSGASAMALVPTSILGWSGFGLSLVLTFACALLGYQGFIEKRRALECFYADSLAEANNRLERSNVDLAHFASVASHDLKAPLRRVVGLSQLMQLRLADHPDEEVATALKMAVENGKHMQHLVDDLLSYSRLDQHVAHTAVSLRDVLDGVRFDRSLDLSEARGEMTVAGDAQVTGTPSLLRELFGNLVGNAIRYRRPDTPPRIRIKVAATHGFVEVSVADNGRGVPEEALGRIFEMFKRVHQQVDGDPGTGLGLATARRIADLHGGTIRVTSRVGKGSTFTVRLPAAP